MLSDCHRRVKQTANRDACLPHPDHTAFGALLRPHLEKVLVVDDWLRT